MPHELQQMLQELADEQGRKMNKSKTKVMMENNTPIYINNTQIENVEIYIYLGQWYSSRDKHQEESQPDGQHSSSTATSSKVTLEHAWRDKSTTHAYFQQWHTVWKHGHSPPRKEQASSRTNKDGKEYVKHHILGQKNIWVREKTKVARRIEEDRSGPGQSTSAGYEITDRHCVSSPGNPTKGKEEGRRDVGETN